MGVPTGPENMADKPLPLSRRHDQRHALIRRAFVLPSRDLGQRVVSGASFTLLGIAARTLLTIGSMAILARLLTPADFGYIAMAAVVTEFASLLASFGLGNILIQKRVVSRLQLDTVFWAGTATGCAIAALVFLVSFATELLFAEPTVGGLLRALSITFVLAGLTTVHEAVLARLMQFHTEFYIRIGALGVRALTSIVFAWLGFGVWSLVAGPIAGALAQLVLMFIAVPFLPRLRFYAAYLFANLRTGGSYMGNTFLYYLMMNVDLLLIGRQLGASMLGYYQNARSLTDEIRGRIAMPLQRVLFPAFSAMQADRDRLRQSVLKSSRILAAIICPIGFGLSAVAEELVPILYGDQWLPMIPVLTMLGIGAALRGSTSIASSLFNAQNRVALSLRYNVVGAIILIGSVLAVVSHGLEAVTAAIALNAMYSIVVLRASFGLIGLDFRDLLHVLARPVLAAIAMWICIAVLRTALAPMQFSTFVALLLHVSTGVVTYSLALHLLSRQYLTDFTDLVTRIRGRQHRRAD